MPNATSTSTGPSAYRTRDLHESAYYFALGFPPTIEGTKDQRVFLFMNVPPEVRASFYEAPCELSAAQLFSSYVLLRRKMFAVGA